MNDTNTFYVDYTSNEGFGYFYKEGKKKIIATASNPATPGENVYLLRFNELNSFADFNNLAKVLEHHGITHILDEELTVPNSKNRIKEILLNDWLKAIEAEFY